MQKIIGGFLMGLTFLGLGAMLFGLIGKWDDVVSAYALGIIAGIFWVAGAKIWEGR